MTTYAETVKFLVAMIIMMNPLGSLSIFLQLTNKFNIKKQKKIALHCGFAITVIMIFSLWLGSPFLDLLSITIDSFRFAGGIILLLVGLSMLKSEESAINHTPEDDAAAQDRQSPAVVPLALPLIIGPGAISTLVLASNDYPKAYQQLWLSLLCIILAFGMTVLLYFAGQIGKLVGESIIKVVTRIMGMLIMAIAVNMLTTGLLGLIPALHS